MPTEAKPLFRPDVQHPLLATFPLPPRVEAWRPKLSQWAQLFQSLKADKMSEEQLKPDFLTDFF